MISQVIGGATGVFVCREPTCKSNALYGVWDQSPQIRRFIQVIHKRGFQYENHSTIPPEPVAWFECGSGHILKHSFVSPPALITTEEEVFEIIQQPPKQITGTVGIYERPFSVDIQKPF